MSQSTEIIRERIEILVSRLQYIRADLDYTLDELTVIHGKLDHVMQVDVEDAGVTYPMEAVDATDILKGMIEDMEEEPEVEAPTDREMWTAEFNGVDPEPHGLALYVRARAIKDALGLTWKQTANLIAGAPDYTLKDSPKPVPSASITDMKYPPRFYPATERYPARWSYPMRDVERVGFALDAAHYWIERFNIDEQSTWDHVLAIRSVHDRG